MAASTESVQITGAQLTEEYLRRVDERALSGADLTQAVTASSHLAVGYRDRFLSRPAFLGGGELSALVADLRTVHTLLESLPDRLFGGSHEAFVRAVGITPVQQAVTARAFTGTVPALSRCDLYRSKRGFELMECNVTSSLGGFENADINRAMLAHPALSEFVAEHDLGYVDTLRAMVDTMLAVCGDNVRGERPVVALTDWPESFVSYEPRLRMLAGLLADMGVDAIPCHVGQLSWQGGDLRVDGRAIDIVYRFFVVREIVTEADAALIEPLLQAAEAGAVGVFTPIGADAYGAKGALAMLSDDQNRHAFAADELACLDRILPWTRHLRRTGTDPQGAEVDLVAYALANQGDLVLKPSLEYGGSGVVPGWTVPAQQWAENISTLIDSGCILQRRIRPEPEPFPQGAGRDVVGVYLNWGIFLVDEAAGRRGYGGCLLRGDADPEAGAVSVGAGALVGCCFHSTEEMR